MKALGIAAAAAIALAPFLVVAIRPGVAQAAPFAGLEADLKAASGPRFRWRNVVFRRSPLFRSPRRRP
jgi:hypothetical protein